MTGHGVTGARRKTIFMNHDDHDDHEQKEGFVSVVAVVVFLTEQQ
jgi:hypothetical protein